MKEKIETLQLSVRSTNCLRQKGVIYIDDLVVLSELNLKRLPNMGVKSINEIKEKLKEIGLGLDMKPSYNISNKIKEEQIIKEEPEINIWLDNITNIQLKQAKLESLFFYMVDNLSARSKNALELELRFHNNITEFLKYLFSLHSVLMLPNVGKTSEFEIQNSLTNIHQEETFA